MRLREFLFGTALMSIALVTTKAGAPTVIGGDCRPDFADDAPSVVEPSKSGKPESQPPTLVSQDKAFGTAYYDTVSILSSNNACSDFFGGPAAVGVFNELVSRIRKEALSAGIGMRMLGPTTNVYDTRNKRNYRLFSKVYVNSRGPFYRKKATLWEPTVSKVGKFEPSTKEARVLMLLHELGHVMKGSDGQWLLPDDGKDEGISRANSYKIEDVCGDELNNLGKVTAMKDLGKYKDPDQQPAQLTTREETQPQPPR